MATSTVQYQYGKPIILIIGATGNVGIETIKFLKKKNVSGGYKIRAAVRDRDLQKAQLRFQDIPGIELVHCDLNEPESIDQAFVGVTKVFLILGLHLERQLHVQRVVDASLRAGVEHFLFLSVVGCDSKSILFAKQFKEGEEIIQNSGLVWTFLRTIFFQNNFLNFSKQIKEGRLPFAWREGKFAPLCVCDIGEAAANILLGRIVDHAYKIYNMTGPDLLDGYQMAEIFSRHLGRPMKYLSPIYKESMSALTAVGFKEWEAKGFLELFEVFASNQAAFVSPDGEALLGHHLTTLEQFIMMNMDRFTDRLLLQKQTTPTQQQVMSQSMEGTGRMMHQIPIVEGKCMAHPQIVEGQSGKPMQQSFFRGDVQQGRADQEWQQHALLHRQPPMKKGEEKIWPK